MARLQRRRRRCARHHRCICKPVQDIQIDTRPTRTQYQYVLQSPRRSGAARWAGQVAREALQKQPDLADVTTDQHDLGQQMMITVDREAAARFGLNISAVDSDLYDAFGQRQIATIYSQIYQYKVILEVAPEYRNTAEALDSLYLTKATRCSRTPQQSSSGVSADFGNPGQQMPLARLRARWRSAWRRSPSRIRINFRRSRCPSICRPAFRSDRRWRRSIAPRQRSGCPSTIETNLVGSAAEFASSLKSEPLLIAAAIVAVYIVLGILYESYIHPITILSTLPSAGIGALLALMLVRPASRSGIAHRHYPADRHREEERHHDGRFCAGRGAQRGIDAGAIDLSGLHAALSADHDDHHGRAVGRAAAWPSAPAPARSCGARSASRSSAACWCRSF